MLDCELGEIQGWCHAALVARHELAGGEYDEETGDFIPPPERPEA